jgi:hypothetical protein
LFFFRRVFVVAALILVVASVINAQQTFRFANTFGDHMVRIKKQSSSFLYIF